MAGKITAEDLQGTYDISYQTTPQIPDWYEPGYGVAKIEGVKLTGVDALGVIWDASFEIQDDGTLKFVARLDPKDAPANAGLLNDRGVMTREPQNYSGVLKVIKTDNGLILTTRVQQGPLLIDVQFMKKK